MARPVIDIPPEKTNVGLETEVKIPTVMAVVGALAVDVVEVGTFLICAIWRLWKIDARTAWTFIAETWGGWMIGLLLPWGLFGLTLAVSFFVQTIDKHSPSTRKPREANSGIFSAWFPKKQAREDADLAYRRAFGGDDNE
jgi:hypothetical protein